MKKKLYIQTNSCKENIFLLCKIILLLNLKYFKIWFYPEVKKKKRKKLLLTFESKFYKRRALHPITVYDDKKKYKKVKLFRIPNEINCIFSKNINELNKITDSICFYKKKKIEWCLCSVIHENMIIVNHSKNLETYLKSKKIKYDNNPPSWW